MAQTRRKPKKTTPQRAARLPLGLLAAGIVLLVLAGGFIVFRGGSAGTPRLVVDQEKLDFGDQHYNQPVTATFRLSNAGDGVLRIKDQPFIQVVEGCCPPDVIVGSRTLQPGESTTLSMTFSMHKGMDGPHDFRVKVSSNDPSAPQKELTILSNWIP